MIRKIIFFGVFMNVFFAFAQVGINTNIPSGALRVNGANSPTDTNPDNDVVISKPSGNMAIGHLNPTVKLDIKTTGTQASPVAGFKLADGNQALNKILHSDENGVGTWKELSIFTGQNIIGTFTWADNTGIGNTNWNRIATLTITPGSHMIYMKIHVLNNSNSGFVRTYVGTKNVGTNNNNPIDTPIIGSTNFQPLMGRDFEITQAFVYNNVTNANVTLYYVLQSDSSSISRSVYTFNNAASFKGVNLIENYFFATPVN
ncbi:hypothetical protein [Chryseobacterium daeguense]|uniref:hypothetical protein n=1 Tax=Chryseobacterium daeguense TaxID=412438 RepID=UPI000480D417|nr:hypothetical protein [Chryseobacterium daeguense]